MITFLLAIATPLGLLEWLSPSESEGGFFPTLSDREFALLGLVYLAGAAIVFALLRGLGDLVESRLDGALVRFTAAVVAAVAFYAIGEMSFDVWP